MKTRPPQDALDNLMLELDRLEDAVDAGNLYAVVIIAIRMVRGVGRSNLAGKLGVPKKLIYRQERGREGPFGPDRMRTMAEALAVPVGLLDAAARVARAQRRLSENPYASDPCKS